MMPYTSVGMPANTTPQCSMQNAMFAPGLIQSPQQHQQQQVGQQQQPIMFSGASGNFFLAQPAAVGGAPVGTPVMLTSGQGNAAGTFMVAHHMPPSAVPGAQMTTSAPANCIIQLPDGRLIMPATAPQPVGFNPSNLSRLPGAAPTAYYSMSMPSGPPVTSNQTSLPQQQQTPGLMAHNQGQTFFIQVPSNATGNYGGGAMLNAVCTASTGPFQQPHQSTGFLKPAHAVPCVGSQTTFPNRPHHPVLMSVAVSSSTQGPCIMSHKASVEQSSIMGTDGHGNQLHHSLIQSTNPPPMDTQLVSQKLCPLVGVTCASPNNLQSFGQSGMAVARLPNGTYTTVAYNRPQTPTSMVGTCSPAPGNGILTPAPTSLGGSGTVQRKASAGSRSAGRQQLGPSMADSTEVLRRLDEQIVMLQNTPQPTEMQSNKLKQLIDARNQLAKTVAAKGSPRSTDASVGATTLRPVRPQLISIPPNLRRELLNTLANSNLLPASVNCTGAETFVVEFRLNQQQYRLRLTRAQKTDMERLLFSVSPQRQAELLTVLQQEQNRFLAPRSRVTSTVGTAATSTTTTTTATTTMVVAPSPVTNLLPTPNCSTTFGPPSNLITQPMRLQQAPVHTFNASPQAPIPMHPHPFGNAAAGLRLVATRPVLQTVAPAGLSGPLIRGTMNAGSPGICSPVSAGAAVAQNAVSVSSAPMMGVVTALAMSPMVTPGQPGTPIFASGLGSTTTTTMVPHGGPISVAAGCGGPGATAVGAGASAGLFLSSFPPPMPGSQTFVMQQQQQPPPPSQQPVMASSSTGPIPLPQNCAPLQPAPTNPPPMMLQQQQQTSVPVAQQQVQMSSQLQQQQPQSIVSQPTRTALAGQTTTVPSPGRAVGLSLQQAARLSRMRACLSHDLKASVEMPTSEQPCPEKLPHPVQLLQALAPYHMLRDADNTDEALEKVDRILQTSISLLFERKRQTMVAVDALLFKQTMEQLKPRIEDRLLLAHMALDLDRDVLAAERQEFSDALGSTAPESSQPTDVNDSEPVDTACIKPETDDRPLVPYLRHPTSVLPPTWQTLLGPLAYLRPLKFDENGNATYASICLPPHPDDPTPPSEKVVGGPSAQCSGDIPTVMQSTTTNGDDNLPRVVEDDEEDGMSDEVEADLLLGLGTRQSRAGMPGEDSICALKNGLHGGGPSLRDSSLGTGVKRGRDKCETIEDAYNLWQELMRGEGMEIDMGDENGSVVHAMDDVEDDDEMGADTLNASLDDEPLADESSQHSLRGLTNNNSNSGAAGMQHSEDPDIDAAVRSILSTSN